MSSSDSQCSHGRPRGPSADRQVDLVFKLEKALLILPGCSQWDFFYDFWKHPIRAHLVDQDLAQIYYCLAVEGIVHRTTLDVHAIAMRGIAISSMHRRGGGVDCDNADRAEAQLMTSVQSKPGLVRFLVGNIPCSCLDEENVNPAMGYCEGCERDFPKQELRKCGNCKLSTYCSKECQKNDWKSHKKLCAGMKIIMKK